MKRTREQIKAELMSAAEGLVDELLDWQAHSPAPTLTQIEDVILELRQQMGQRMAAAVLGAQSHSPVPSPRCATCEREMRFKGCKVTEVESRLGVLQMERGYYYCPSCRAGFFPPGSAVGGMGEALEYTSGQAEGVAERVTAL
jgi:uncharacterized protein with PIN domain